MSPPKTGRLVPLLVAAAFLPLVLAVHHHDDRWLDHLVHQLPRLSRIANLLHQPLPQLTLIPQEGFAREGL